MMTHRALLRRATCLAAAVALLLPSRTSAAARSTAVSIPTGLGTVRYPDSAYEPQANVFLAVTGASVIKGQWVSAAGALLGGAFTVSSSANYQQTPAVQCGENGVCIVVWHETTGNLATPMARLLSYSGGFITGPFALGPAGSMWEMTAGVTYSAAAHEFLVTWQGDYPGANNVWVARVNLAGQVAASFALTTGTAYEREPSVAYNPASGEYIVAYEGMTGNVAYTAAQRFANGAKVGNPIVLDNAGAEYISSAEYDSQTQSVLVAWSRGTQSIYARAIAANGTPGSLLLLSSSYGAYDALDASFNPISNSFLIVTHGSLEDVGIEVSSAYAPTPAFTLTANGGNGNFNPRISTSTVSPLWFAVTATSFTTLNGQFATSTPNAGGGGVPPGDPPPPPSPPPPPACTYSLSLTATGVSPFGGSGAISVTTTAGCNWNAASNASWIAVSGSGSGSGSVSVTAQPNPSYAGSRTGTITIAGQTVTFTQPRRRRPDVTDFDGDGKSDAAIFRPSNSTWYVRLSSTGATVTVPFGMPNDKPVPGDYDGDGKTDVAVYRPSTGMWYIKYSSNSSVGQVQWGGDPSDIPVAADYDGDGKTDIAVYRKSIGNWYIIYSSTGTGTGFNWGGLADDWPVVGDFDGDGRADPTIFRRSSGGWYVYNLRTGTSVYGKWGIDTTDIPTLGDFDGDGNTDLGFFHAATGGWWIYYSSTHAGAYYQWGNSPTNIPTSADFTGDGKTDLGVFAPGFGFYTLSTGSNQGVYIPFGVAGDIPVTK
jgi:hypothetical protein